MTLSYEPRLSATLPVFFPSADAPQTSSFPSGVLTTILCKIEEFYQVLPARTHARPPPPAMTIFVV